LTILLADSNICNIVVKHN